MKTLLPLFPTLASFGPLFMILFSSSDVAWVRLVGILGALMTSGALLLLFRTCISQAKELEALRER